MERLIAWYRVGSSVGAVVALVLANAVPLLGVLFFGWNVWTILIVYWLENGVVGVFNVLKMLKAEGPDDGSAANLRINGRRATALSRSALIPFFILHYGIFWIVHGIFVLLMPVFASFDLSGTPDMTEGADPWTVMFALAALFISHGVSYVFNYLGRGEYRRVSAAALMAAPYGRLVALHVTIIIGGMAIAMTGAPVAALVILVVLKTVLDVGFHLADHRRVSGVGAGSPAEVEISIG